jgi:uncharacterized membrane protein
VREATPKLVRQDRVGGAAPLGAWLLPALVAALAAAFVLAPWPLSVKAQAVLHGLCAQRPSHSLTLGGATLPFDARMTGIYGGFAVTTLYLLARGRFRAFRLPSRGTLALLVAFVAAMAVDGTNALLVDLRIDPLYAPDNRLRLATGLLTGVSLGVMLCFLVATTVWRRGDWARRTVSGPGEVALIVALQIPFAAVALSGWGVLYAPVAVGLVVAAVVAVSALALTTLLLLTCRDRSYERLADAQLPAAAGLALGVAAMLVIAGARFWLERAVGLPPLT